LLIHSIPRICAANAQVDFIIGGDGPKREEIEQMVVAEGLQNRVKLVGSIRHEDVRDFLVQVIFRIFLSVSL
jgi:phosphatidylinositol glycan class A protein